MTRAVFETMGTVVSLATGGMLDDAVTADVRRAFDRYDRRYSLYDPRSELSALAAGRLRLTHAVAEVREVYAESLEWSRRTLGAFTPHRPDGVLDLSGIVKALAIDAAGRVLDEAGVPAWVVDCGGDAWERRAPDRRSTTVGIADPLASGALLTAVVVTGTRRAVATSGVSERGEHVWGPRVDYAQVTVVADGIVEADVLATAILAGGVEVCDHVAGTRRCDILAVRRDGGIDATRGIRFAERLPSTLRSGRADQNATPAVNSTLA